MRSLLLLPLLLSLNSNCQWKDFMISVRGDTLNRVDMKGLRQGPWVFHVEELRGEPGYDEQGYYSNNKKEGTWVRFSLMGDKIAEENYRWGNLNGKCRYYTRAGMLLREESWRAINPDNATDTVDVFDLKDPSKVVDRVIVKLTGQTMKHGVWTYFDPNEGTIEKKETYWLDKPATGNGQNEDELKPLDVSINSDSSAVKKPVSKPQVVVDYEKKNSGKKKVKVRDGRTSY